MYYFLDVDGVLNRESDWKNPFTINQQCLKNFVKLIKKDKDPHIVLSSTWRVGFTNRGEVGNGNKLTKALGEYGLCIDGCTPVSNKTRQEEIEFYIRRNGIVKYLVLDDDASLFPEAERLCVYFTNYKTGITEQDVKQIAKKYLK